MDGKIKVAQIYIFRTHGIQKYRCRLDRPYEKLLADLLAKVLSEESKKGNIVSIEIVYMTEEEYQKTPEVDYVKRDSNIEKDEQDGNDE